MARISYATKIACMKLLAQFLVGGLLALITSCASKTPTSLNEIIVYPSPPEETRIQYLTTISTSKDVDGGRSKFGKFVAGDEVPKPVIKPYGATFHNGKIYVCDLDLKGLEIIDMDGESFEYFVPKGLGQLTLPINCCLDSLDYLYVADSQRKQVVVYDQNRQYVCGIGAKENFKPTDVVVSNNKIWIANIKNGSVDVYSQDSTHQFLYSLPGKSATEGKLYQPTNLYITNDKVYVSDFGEFNVKIYDHEGKYIRSVGSYGKNIGQFTRPKGIAVDRDENLYVVDAAFENVQIFNKEGKLLMFFGGTYQGPGGMWLPAKVTISYEMLDEFQKYVDERYLLKYLILVTNNYGPDKISIYGYVEEKSLINN